MIHILNKKKEEVSTSLDNKLVCFAIMYVGFFFHFLFKLISRPTYYDRAHYLTSERPDFYSRPTRVTKQFVLAEFGDLIHKTLHQTLVLPSCSIMIAFKRLLSAYLGVLYSWWDLLLMLLRSHLDDVDSMGDKPETPEDLLSCGVGRLLLLPNPC